MKKIISYVKQNSHKIATGIAAVAMGAVIASPALADTLDPDIQSVASTTQNYLKGQFTAALVYIIPAVLGLFVLFWVFKFVKRKMPGAAH